MVLKARVVLILSGRYSGILLLFQERYLLETRIANVLIYNMYKNNIMYLPGHPC